MMAKTKTYNTFFKFPLNKARRRPNGGNLLMEYGMPLPSHSIFITIITKHENFTRESGTYYIF